MISLAFYTKSAPPSTPDEWRSLRTDVSMLFTPHSPIDEEEMFADRIDLVDKLIEVIFQEGRHAVMYGERGVGKSSLVNIIKDKLFSKVVSFNVVKRSCTSKHNFKLIWQHVFSDYDFNGVPAGKWLDDHCNPFDIYQLVQHFASDRRPIFIIDEFDKVVDAETKVLMADTIKYLADYKAKATLIIVGVADTVTALIDGHESVTRNIAQMHVKPMSAFELRQIITSRLPLLNMSCESDCINEIVNLSQGLPGYTHLLTQAAGWSAVDRKSLSIETSDVDNAITLAINDTSESIRDDYDQAIRSTKPGNQYKQVLLACALAEVNDRGLFQRTAVREKFSLLMGRYMDIPAFARHMNEFCKPERGPALIKEGRAQSFEYRFADPLLRPFVVMKGAATGVLNKDGSIRPASASSSAS